MTGRKRSSISISPPTGARMRRNCSGIGETGRRAVHEHERRDAIRLRRRRDEGDRAAERVADEDDAADAARVEIAPEMERLRSRRVVVGPRPLGESRARQVHGDRRPARRGRRQDALPGRRGGEKAVHVHDGLFPLARRLARSPAHAVHDRVALSRARRRDAASFSVSAAHGDREAEDQEQRRHESDEKPMNPPSPRPAIVRSRPACPSQSSPSVP